MIRWSFAGLYQAALGAILLACVVVFVIGTRHWTLVGDPPLIHYIAFLMGHGWVPYRDIVDVNMPGAYFVDYAVIHTIGGGSLAWRIFDLLLDAGAAASMVAMAWPRSRYAGFFAGALFLLLHGRDGVVEMGQRDLTMAVLALAGCAFLFHAARAAEPARRLWATAVSGLFLGCAITVKPTAVFLFPPLLVLFALELRRRGKPWRRQLLTALAGVAIPLLLVLGYLVHERALGPFLTVLFRLIPAHGELRRHSFGYLAAHCVAGCLPALILAWLPVALFGRLRRNWESAALVVGVLAGLASFFAQGKGFPYHRYPAEAFLLLLICIDLCCGLRTQAAGRRWVRPVAAVVLAAFVAIAGVESTHTALGFNWRNRQFNTMLVSDLNHLGGQSLQGKVQCMDMAAGCLNALFHMRLVTATGFLFDCYVLQPASNDGGYRQRFWREITADPPKVFVVTNVGCNNDPRNYKYRQLDDWPQFAAWLNANYSIYADRIPSEPMHWTGHPAPPFGYRIYVRDGLRRAGLRNVGTPAPPPS